MAEEEKRTFDVLLSDGREVVFDFSKITHKEWRALLDPKQPDRDGWEIMYRVTGITPDELDSMSEDEAQRLLLGMYRAHNNPLKFKG